MQKISLRSLFQSLIPSQRRPADAPTLRHYIHQDGSEHSRIHLRIDANGTGLLLVNASRVMHLNPTAAFMAHLALEETSPERAIAAITHKYDVPVAQAAADYALFTVQLKELVRPDGACPLHEMDNASAEAFLNITPPFSARPSAPYRMDLALTYRCNNDCAHCYNARPRYFPEMASEHWKRILEKVWEIGIPHVVFTGGEPSMRQDLEELVGYAGQLGMIAGLNTNGRRLADRRFLNRLVQAGLDHVQITLESHEPAIHDSMVGAQGAWRKTVAGLENALDSPLYVMTNTTLLRQNSPSLKETLAFLAKHGVPTVGLNALIHSGRGASVGTGLDEDELPALLDLARAMTDANNQRLVWYTPTQYCRFDPMQLELGVKACTAALYNMCVEPDGSVIPCQSYYEPVGNILNDSWDSIWNHKLSVHLRERGYIAAKCRSCVLLSECGGGCPLTPSC